MSEPLQAFDVESEGDLVRVVVELAITHTVWVTLPGRTTDSMEKLKEEALKRFTSIGADGRPDNARRRSEDEWKARFGNLNDIKVAPAHVRIASFKTTPAGSVL